MASQQIVWIAVPQGLRSVGAAVRARISVFVSPRLELDDDNLAGTFLNWPERLQAGDVTFEVHFGDVSRTATMVSQTFPGLWTALFDENTFVRAHRPDETSGIFQSYATVRLHDVLKSGYQETFESSPLDPPAETVPPAFDTLRALFVPQESADEPTGSDDDARARLGRELFRPADAATMQARLDQLVDLAVADAQRDRENGLQPATREVIPDTGDAALDLARFGLFHRQPGGRHLGVDVGEPTAADARIDFHQQLANLGEYPALQRRLGLIIDLEADITDIPHTAPDAHELLRVVPRFGEPLVPTTTPITPDTAYVLSSTEFRAAPSGPPPREIEEGLLNLSLTIGDGGAPQFRIIQVDLDSAGFNTIDLLTHAAAGESDDGAGLASLRSSGVSIARYGNGRFLMDVIGIGLDKMARIAAGRPDVVLFAEDLIRGYRIDVRESPSAPWRSLHERAGAYRLNAGQPLLLSDEGFLQPSLVQPPTPDSSSTTHSPTAPNYVAESLFLWQGWSLAARRPGPEMSQPSEPNAGAPAPPSDVKLDVSFSAALNSLPRLRFGQRYEFRVRLADLVGGGVTSDEANAALNAFDPAATRPVLPPADEPFRYLRFDVVPSPVVLPRIAPGRGASVERVVLRSNHDMAADAYADDHPEFPEYALSGERHVVPPKTWQLLAEASGFFDSSIGTATDLERTHELTLRAGRSLGTDEVHPDALVTAPYLPDPLAVGAALRGLPGVASGTLGRVDRDALRLDGELADGPRSAPLSVITIGFGSEWPDLQGFRMRLVEGSQPPQWDATQRVLSVSLPKGETRTINVSSHLADQSALELMGMWTWLMQRLDELVSQGLMTADERAALVGQLRQLSIAGQSWMITPPRQLALVHAVQQPLERPTVRRFVAVRLPDKTYAGIDAVIGVHGATTGQVALHWTSGDSTVAAPGAPALPNAFVLPPHGESSPAAAPGDPRPIATFDAATNAVTYHAPNVDALEAGVRRAVVDMNDAVADLKAAANGLVPSDIVPEDFGLFEPGDPNRPSQAALRAKVRAAQAMASKAQSDVLDEQFVLDFVTITERWRRLADLAGRARGWADGWVGNPPDPGFPAQLPRALHGEAGAVGVQAETLVQVINAALAELEGFPARHEFGDTKYRKVTYRAVATTRFGDCFPDSTTSPVDLTRTSDEFTVDVLNTATPPRPRIAYIVPAFGWHRQGTAEEEGFTSQRDAGGLRVYLEGPWFLSGEGEQLGVVVTGISNANVVGPGLVEWSAPITNWARDPLWDTDSPRELPAKDDFPSAATIAEKVCLPDGNRDIVTIAGFMVETDDTGRHYCDITLDPEGSYYPFVRLALTRFQPNSIRGVESSAAVIADFAQLSPGRSVSVVSLEQLLLQVTVAGITHRSPADPSTPVGTGTRVRVRVQERIPGSVDDAGWISNDDAVVTELGGELWTGTVRIPNRPPGTLRLLIEEFETHAMFQQELGDPETIERVVFAETVIL
jgi:hypothetical protein